MDDYRTLEGVCAGCAISAQSGRTWARPAWAGPERAYIGARKIP